MSLFRRRLMIANALKKSSGINYPGLIAAYDIEKEGKDNDHIDREWLRDLTGNGHDIHLFGFAFSEMSGYGGYSTDFNNWGVDSSTANIERTSTSFKLTPHKENGKLITSSIRWTNNTTSVKIKFRVNEFNGTSLKLQQQLFDSSGASIAEDILAGIQVNQEYVATIDNIDSKYVRRNIFFSGTDTNILAVELLPEYPDALVFDGVDDYSIPIWFDDTSNLTIICKYQVLALGLGNTYSFNSYLRAISTGNNFFRIKSKSIQSLPTIEYYSISDYKIKYKSTAEGSNIDRKNLPFNINGFEGKELSKVAFYSAYIFNRSLDEQEIKGFIRKYIDPEYLLPSEIPTPDCYYDFSQGSNEDENRETIKDQSGNGNDAKAYNIAWAGMPGYGGYDIDFKTEYQNSLNVNRVTGTLSSTKFNITSVKNTNAFLESSRLETHPSYKVKVTGVSDNLFLTYQYGTGNNFHIKTEGIHTIPAVETETQYVGFKAYPVTENCNITLELLPEYPGALVLDGTDDYIALEAFTSGFKTMFMLVNPLIEQRILYDSRFRDSEDYAIFNIGSNIAYTQRNINGAYINGVFNTTVIGRNLVNKKHLITVNSKLESSKMPIIGANNNYNGLFSNMAIYKFLGFKDELTEEQIKAIIKKYNLLDGVDEIEVS